MTLIIINLVQKGLGEGEPEMMIGIGKPLFFAFKQRCFLARVVCFSVSQYNLQGFENVQKLTVTQLKRYVCLLMKIRQ